MIMTAEEVRNQLEELIRDRESFMVGDYDKDIYDRDKEALEFAVKAVEKQIHLKEKINQLQTYKLFHNDKETYLSKQDVIDLVSEIEREVSNE